MNKERLLKLADFLDNLPKEKFDIDTIVSGKLDKEKHQELTCGSTACAIGWMPKVFPDLCRWVRAAFSIGVGFLDKAYFEYNIDSFATARQILNLTRQETEWLFEPDSYSSYEEVYPKDVSKRIRTLVENGVLDV